MVFLDKLVCSVQHYEWGCKGSESLVAQLAHSANAKNCDLDENKTYAELWMGVHKNGPSLLSTVHKPLAAIFANHRTILAPHENGTLQYLFKVLSVNKALSIQSHPNLEKAKLLHELDPAHYPDDNHKPEMAIALGDFQLLCGFRPSNEVYENIKACPEIVPLLKGEGAVERLLESDDEVRRSALKEIFGNYMRSSQSEISAAVSTMIERLQKKTQRSSLDDLIIRLNTEFPNDVGVFAPLLMNYFTLKDGESVFLGPNLPHAYLSGNCIECMACSDNTVRAGLTPKFKDVDTLCSDLTFEMAPPPFFKPEQLETGIVVYAPPVSEFAVHKINHEVQKLKEVNASSIMIVISGSAVLQPGHAEVPVKKGEVVFFSADSDPIPILSSGDFRAYRAFTPVPVAGQKNNAP